MQKVSIAFAGKVLELTGLIMVGIAILEGIGEGKLGPDLRLSVLGGVFFFLGWVLEARIAGRR